MSHSIVIVDDHTLVAEALAGIVETFRDYHVLYDVPNGKAMIERFSVPRNIPDIVLLDISMPVMDGYQTAEWLTTHYPDVRILVLSMQDDEEALIKMLRCGARGYLVKNVRAKELNTALDMLVEKGYFYPDWMTYKVLTNIAHGKPVANPGPVINGRELEFIKYSVTELTYKEIADKMCCSPRTVEGYRDSLFEKFGVKTRVGLVISALKSQLIKL